MKNKMKIINSILIFLLISLSCLIFQHKTINLSFLQNIFYSMIAHTSLEKGEINVSNSINFIKVSQYTYTNTSYCIYSPFKATVIEIYESSLILKSNDNLYIYYEDIFNINVKKMDYVNYDDVLANFDDVYKMYFVKEGKIYSYEEIIGNN